jgi:hypothetical protein
MHIAAERIGDARKQTIMRTEKKSVALAGRKQAAPGRRIAHAAKSIQHRSEEPKDVIPLDDEELKNF